MKLFISLCICTLLAAAVYFGLYRPEQALQNDLRSRAETLETQNDALRQRSASLEASNLDVRLPEGLLWRAPAKPDAELALQDATLKLASDHGVSLSNFGTAQLSRDIAQGTVAFEIEGTSSLGEVYRFLEALEQQSPRTAVAALRVRPDRRNGGDDTEISVYFQMTVWGFWGDPV